MKRLAFHSLGVLFLCYARHTLASDNVCENKHWLPSPVVVFNSNEGAGIGGTGLSIPIKSDKIATLNREGESGIGGTGLALPVPSDKQLVKKEEESGIGGTGIVGIISGFGSICVDGVEIHFKENTTITEDGVPTDSNRLALGQTVSILAHTVSDNYYANEIRLLNEVKGQVHAIDTEHHVFEVLGQTVHLPTNLLEKITTGDYVIVSGNRLNDGSIDAIRVEKSDQFIEKLSVIGPVEKEVASGQLYIGKQRIDVADNHLPPLQTGDEVRVQGVLNDNVLHVEAIEHNPRWSFSSRVDQLFIQGHVREDHGAQLNIDGLRFGAHNHETKLPQTGQYIGLSANTADNGTMILNHWQERQHFSPEHNHSHHVDDHVGTQSTLKENKAERELGAMDRRLGQPHSAIIDRPEIDHHDFERHDINKPDIDRPEIEKYEITHPDIDRPDINHADIDKPTLLRLEVNRPDSQRPHH